MGVEKKRGIWTGAMLEKASEKDGAWLGLQDGIWL